MDIRATMIGDRAARRLERKDARRKENGLRFT
jgi:hypothetical protein